MAITNYETRELILKIMYFGASGSGKTENLRSIYRLTSPEVRAGLFELEGKGQSSFFECVPLSLGYVRDYHIKLHVYSYAKSPFMPSVDGSLLRGLDGYVVVFDSRKEAFGENLSALDETNLMLTEAGYNLADLPRVIQYNKMDLNGLVPLNILREELNPGGSLECESVAISSEGTMETLRLISQQVLREIISEDELNPSSGGIDGRV